MQSSKLIRGAAVAASLAAGCVFASNTAFAQSGVYGFGYDGGYAYGGDPSAWGVNLVADTIGFVTAPFAGSDWGYSAYPYATAYSYAAPGYGYSYYGYGPSYAYAYPDAYAYDVPGYAAYPYSSSYGYAAPGYAYGYGHRIYRLRYDHGYRHGRFIVGQRLQAAAYTTAPRHGRYGYPMMRRHPRIVQSKMIHAQHAQQAAKHYRAHLMRQARD